ncbi:MAG: multidrug effflux MFS transporter [Boseongicola sp.]|nr:multidrug effflux MFS transporter [Boseongicola sp.]
MASHTATRFLDRATPPHLFTLVLMAGVAAMNMSAFLPSLPAMTTYFDTDYGIMQLSVSLYLAGTAVLQLIIGPISDHLGRRPVVLGSLAVFVLASIGCLLSPSIEVFLAFRMLQGTVVVGLVLSRAIVRDLYDQDESASMIGYVTMGMALVPMVAPTIGGILDQLFNWQATFVLLAVAGVGAFVVCFFDQGETVRGEPRSFMEQVRDYPELLKSRRFWGYVFAAAFGSGTFFAFLGGGPKVASDIYGLSSFWSGVGFGAPPIGYAIGNGISGRFSTRAGVNRMVIIGTAVTFVGLAAGALATFAGFGSAVLFFAACTSIGLGNGMVIPNASAGMLSVRPHLAGTASGLGGAIMVGGGAAFSVLAGIVLELGQTDLPLLLLMVGSAALGLISILYVVIRERQIADA